MCGRFTLVPGGAGRVPEFFDVRGPAPAARWNLAPSQSVAVVRDDGAGARELAALRWGLIPAWTRDLKKARAPINARSETVAEKPSFRAAFRARRCLVPASGWYEWQKPQPDSSRTARAAKQPWLIWCAEFGHPDENALFAFAGIWERWTPQEGEAQAGEALPAGGLETIAILTADARPEVTDLHPRMPVVLRPEEYAGWLDPECKPEQLQRLLVPVSRPELRSRAVSTWVNSVRNESPECIREDADLFG